MDRTALSIRVVLIAGLGALAGALVAQHVRADVSTTAQFPDPLFWNFTQHWNTFQYSGSLRDATGQPINGNVDMQISIYADPTNQVFLYRETIRDVVVRDGEYSVVVGAGSDADIAQSTANPATVCKNNTGEGHYSYGANRFPKKPLLAMLYCNLESDKSFYVGVSVDGQAELVPRHTLRAVPFAADAYMAHSLAASSSIGRNTSAPNLYGPDYKIGGNGPLETKQDATLQVSNRTSEEATGFSAWFEGNVRVVGIVRSSTALTELDHPADPANTVLRHAAVGSNELLNIYSGNTVLGATGDAWITLPEWVSALHKDFRYQLTCVGGVAPVYIAEPVKAGRFRVAGGTPGLTVSWQVTGVRADPQAVADPLVVEEAKPEGERGKYLNPAAYGKPASMGIGYHEQKLEPGVESDK